MSDPVQCLIVALTLFLTADALLWFLFQPLSPRSQRDQSWARLRREKSLLFRYAERPVWHLGRLICKLLPARPLNYRWQVGSAVVPFSAPILAGYQFILTFFPILVAAIFWYRFSTLSLPLVIATTCAFFWSMVQVRIAQKRFLDKLLQVQVDLGFAIDMAELYHNEQDGKSMSVANAIQLVYREFKDTELGAELSIVNADLNGNIALSDSLKMMHQRMNWDDHIGRFVDLVSAQYDGSASKDSLRQLADELNRYRRNLLINHAEQAKIKLALPTTLVTFACIFVLTAPFLVRMGDLLSQFST